MGVRFRWLLALLVVLATVSTVQRDQLRAEEELDIRSHRLVGWVRGQLPLGPSPLPVSPNAALTAKVLATESGYLVMERFPETSAPIFQPGSDLATDLRLSAPLRRCRETRRAALSEPIWWEGGYAVLVAWPEQDQSLTAQVVPARALIAPALDPVSPPAVTLVDITSGATGQVLFDSPPQGIRKSSRVHETIWPMGGRLWCLAIGAPAPEPSLDTALYALASVGLVLWALRGHRSPGRPGASLAEFLEQLGQVGPGSCEKLVRLSAEATHVDRVSLWLLEESEQVAVCRVRCDRRRGQETSGHWLERAQIPNFLRLLASEPVVAAGQAQTDPRLEEFRSLYLVPARVRALLAVPILLDGRVVGALSLETRQARSWTQPEARFAQSVAGLISLALERERKTLDSGGGSQERRRQELEQRHRRVSRFLFEPGSDRLGVDRSWLLSLGLPGSASSSRKAFLACLRGAERVRLERALAAARPGQPLELRLTFRTPGRRRIMVQLEATWRGDGRLVGTLRDLTEWEQWLELAGGPVFRLGRGGSLEPQNRAAVRLVAGGVASLSSRRELAAALRRGRRRGSWRGSLQLALGEQTEPRRVRLLVARGAGFVRLGRRADPVVPSAPAPAEGSSILVLDDHEGVLASLGWTLRSHGYRAHLARSLAEARELLARHPVDLVLADRSLAGEGGWEAADSLVAEHPGLKLMRMTGDGSDWPEDVLRKPFKQDVLIARLVGLLGPTPKMRNS